MKKEIYANKITKRIDNNQNYCDVSNNSKKNISNDLTVEEKINKLFNTNGYVFNIDVKIITDNKTYDTKVAGKIGNNLITLDNDVISIKEIKDIIF